MSGAWVAGCVRARLLVSERTLGPEGARELAGAPTLAAALARLGRSPYRREVRHDFGVADAQRAVAAKLLVDLRLLAGWLPAEALGLLRALAGWFELANVDDRLAYLAGAPLRTPFELGSLATAWPRAAAAQTVSELRAAAAASSWGDPGGATAAELSRGLHAAWARRVEAEVPELATLVRAAVALTAEPDWRGEVRWWHEADGEAATLLHAPLGDRRVVTGAVVALAVDAHRAATAIGACARRGLAGVEEVLDAAA